jgi:hypothetical protein
MPKVRFLIATLTVAIMLLLPAVAQAQPEVHGFYGSVALNGKSVEDGTTVIAKIGGEEVATTTTDDSMYTMNIMGPYEGETVQFMVGEGKAPAMEKWTFEYGARDELDLHAYPSDVTTSITLNPKEGMSTTACGTGFTPGMSVTVTFDGDPVAMLTVDEDGKFCTPVNPTASDAGSYVVEAKDEVGKSASQAFTSVGGAQGLKGDKGDPGEQGPQGPAGATGPQGDDGDAGSGSVLAIVALIIAVIAVILAVVFGMRSKQQPAA